MSTIDLSNYLAVETLETKKAPTEAAHTLGKKKSLHERSSPIRKHSHNKGPNFRISPSMIPQIRNQMRRRGSAEALGVGDGSKKSEMSHGSNKSLGTGSLKTPTSHQRNPKAVIKNIQIHVNEPFKGMAAKAMVMKTREENKFKAFRLLQAGGRRKMTM